MAGASFFAVLSCLGATPASAACTLTSPTTWNIAGNGNWSVAGNGNPAATPNSGGTNVCITNGTSTVTLNSTFSVGSLQIDAGNALTMTGHTLLVSGPQIINSGSLGVSTGIVGFNASTALSGGGNVTLAGGFFQQQVGGVTMTNTDNAIEGFGTIGNGGLALNNQATINANVSTKTLKLNGSGGNTNTGLLEATGGGILQLSSVVNNTGGNITASGAGSSVDISTTITGGTLNTNTGGVIQSDGTATLANVTISTGSTYTGAAGNNTLFSAGTINNQGTIALGGLIGLNTGNVALSGGGTLTMAAGSIIQQQIGGLTLTNTNNLIQGAGTIGNGGLALNNQATINANVSTKTLKLNGSGGNTNTGLLEATGGGILQLSSVVNNTGGNITASGAGSSVDISTTITGGTLNTNTGGVMQSDGTATLANVTISTGSTYTGGAGNNTFFSAGTITNQGTIALGGLIGLNTGNVALTGGGTVTMANGSIIQQQIGGLTLTNTNNLIQGAGTIGNGGLALDNQATINANLSTKTLNLNGSGGNTNTGLLEATNGGILQLSSGVTNTGGNITASGAGSIVNVSTTIVGGTLNTNTGGVMQTNSSATLDNVTISAGSTYTGGAGTNTFFNAGTINNQGTIALSGLIGLNTGNVALTGGGTVTMAAGAIIQQQIGGLILTNTNNLIQGAGTLGNNGLAFVNSGAGTVIANVSGQTLTVNGSGGNTNTGLLKATNGATLQLSSNVNNAGGQIIADGGTVNVSTTIQAGTLKTQNGGVIQTVGNATLDGRSVPNGGQGTLTIQGTYTSSPGSNTFVEGTINNTGNILLNATAGNVNMGLALDTTLTGGGTVTMVQSGGSVSIQQQIGGLTLTNLNNTIQGAGAIGNGGLALNNQGTVNANASGQVLLLNNSGGTTNTGLLEATNGGILQIANTVNNVGGNITASGAGSTVNVGTTIIGGTLNTNGGGVMQTSGGNATLDNVTISAGSTYTAGPSTNTFLSVGTITNQGTIALGGLMALNSGNVALTGGGTVNINGGVIQQQIGALTLTNTNNLIQGAGTIGNGGLKFVNGAAGTVNASVSGQTLFLNGSGGNTNNGVFKAAQGATLLVQSNLTNFSGSTLTGGTYQAFGSAGSPAVIQIVSLGNTGGEIHTNAANILLDGQNSKITDNAGLDALSNLSANSGSFAIQNGRNYTSAGSIANTGLIAVGNPVGGDAPSTFTMVGALTGTTGTVQINPNGNFVLGANSTTGTLTHNGNAAGSLALGSNNITVSSDYTNANFGVGNSFNNHANVSGSGQINAAGDVGVSISGAGITGGTTATPTLALGNVHVGGNVSANFNVNNTGTTGPVLRGAIQNTGLSTTGLNISAANFGPIALGGSQAETLTFAPNVGGSLAGQSFKVVTNFDNVQSQTVGVTGTAWNYAQATVNTAQPVAFGNHHVGDVITQQAISITNSAPASFSERLDASVSGTTGGVTTNGGSFNLLAGAATNNTAIKVGIDTSSAGNKGGQATLAFVSDGTGTSGLGNTALASQNVAVTGTVYNLASSNTIAPINFGVVHVGTGIHTQTLSVTNTAAPGAFSEGLDSSFGSYTNNGGSVNPSFAGSFTNLTAGSTNNASMVASLDTAVAGFVQGNIIIHQASNGATTSGLGITALADQNPAVTGTVQATVTNLAQPIINNAQPISFGNVRINTATTAQVVSVTNGAPVGAFTEGLIGSAVGTTGTGIIASGGFGSPGNSLAPQGTNPPNPPASSNISVNIDTSSAGAKSGNAVLNFQSDGTAFNGGTVTDLGNTNVAVSGNVYRLATGSAGSPVNLGATRVGGGPLSGNISVTNTAANDGFSEKLNAGITGTTPSVTGSSGSVSGLVAGATNNSGLSVTLDSSSSGLKSGTATVQFQSDGTGIDGGAAINNGSQVVTVQGKVYQTAVASVTPGPINFGIVHVGDVVSNQSINVANTASGALVDVIIGNIASVTGPTSSAFTTSGNLVPAIGVGAGGNSPLLQVGLNTSTAGVYSGNANLALASHNPDMSDVALATAPVLVQAQVNNFANGAFVSKGGAGTLTKSGSNFLLDFGTLTQGGTLTSNLAVLNDVVGPADDLAGIFALPVLPGDLHLTGFNSFANLLAGTELNGFQIDLDTSFTSFFDVFVTLDLRGTNASGYFGDLPDITLELRGNIIGASTDVPEPLTLSLFGTGIGGLVLVARRRRRAAHA